MSIVEETLNRFVRDTLNTLISADYAIKAEQNAPAPDTAYATVKTVSINSSGMEEHELVNQVDPDLDLVETTKAYREVMFSINFYKDSAKDNAYKSHMGLTRYSVQELLKAANLGLIRRSDVRSISEPIDSSWEERAQFDLVLSLVGTDSEIVRSILAVEISGDLQSRGLSNNVTIGVQ